MQANHYVSEMGRTILSLSSNYFLKLFLDYHHIKHKDHYIPPQLRLWGV